jgi:predicted ArsR family transcriptional regulator
MARLSVKKSQIELMHLLKNVDKWLTAAEIAERLEVHPNKVRRLIATPPFKDVTQGTLNTGRSGGGKYVKVYKLTLKKTHSDEALTLARQHQGIWGQLNWSNKRNVEVLR